MDEYGQRLQDLIGPYDEGSNLKLICDVDGGDPSPSVTWLKDELLVDEDFNVTTRGFVRNVLTLDRIRREDWMAQYTCRASNTHLVKPKMATVQLEMNLLPLEVLITGHPDPMLSGERYHLTCQSTGSRPVAVTSWWFSGTKVVTGTSETVDESENATTNVLQFIPSSEDHGKDLVCKAANPAIPKSTVQAAVVLNVQFSPVLNLSINGNYHAISVQEGDEVTMDCSVAANPWINDIKWHFEHSALLESRPSRVLINNQTLIIQHAKKEHSRSYYCSAENSVNIGRSNSIEVFVKFAPKCRSNKQKMFVLTANETINITCDVEAEPDDIVFKWLLETSQGKIILQKWNSSNMFFYLHDYSSGVLSCWGRNSVDVQVIPCQFQLITATVPDHPHSCTLGNLTERALNLECESGHNGSLVQIFHLEVRDSVTEELVDNLTNPASPIFDVVGLSPRTTYVLMVYASNARGRSTLMTLITTTLMPAERRTAHEIKMYINLILRILFGIVVGFCGMVSLICLVLALRKLRNKKRRDRIAEYSMAHITAEKKELENALDGSEKGPDIIPQSADEDVFFMSGKLVENSISSKTSPIIQAYRKYKHTIL